MYVIKPRLSEKAYSISQTTNTFVLDVPARLNKHEIAAAIEKQFEVRIERVRIINRKGKAKRVTNTTGKRHTNRYGKQDAIKKAYVTLHSGSHLPFFEAEEAEAQGVAKDNEKKVEKAKPVVTKAAAKVENKTAHRGLLRSRRSGEK